MILLFIVIMVGASAGYLFYRRHKGKSVEGSSAMENVAYSRDATQVNIKQSRGNLDLSANSFENSMVSDSQPDSSVA